MSFLAERQAFEVELDGYYAAYPSDLGDVNAELHTLSPAHADWLPHTRKAAGYSASFTTLSPAIQDETIARTTGVP